LNHSRPQTKIGKDTLSQKPKESLFKDEEDLRIEDLERKLGFDKTKRGKLGDEELDGESS
jgi:hypothetical protein